ncbi:hypothetical protein OQJ59_04160 [Microbulbifer thermotolerans]|nr:hypothetical protein [Microbulbifer thermotolerans]MCX2793906.1 hypothetical protein [Microbulbifer thermotolerans]MCX2833502.1 hypothetical protein [Microbulbifer thermotolerans]MCX2840806.1 hypothetical protein [Microbulbifer thermotolerans]
MQITELHAQKLFVKKDHGIESGLLRVKTYRTPGGQVPQPSIHFRRAHILRATHLMKTNKVPHPKAIGFLCTVCQITGPHKSPEAVHEAGRTIWNWRGNIIHRLLLAWQLFIYTVFYVRDQPAEKISVAGNDIYEMRTKLAERPNEIRELQQALKIWI